MCCAIRLDAIRNEYVLEKIGELGKREKIDWEMVWTCDERRNNDETVKKKGSEQE